MNVYASTLLSGEYILKCMENIETIISAKIEERITDGQIEEWKHIHSWTK